MSPHQHYEIARSRQQEIVSSAINSHRADAGRIQASRRPSVRHRVGQFAAVLGVCVAAGTAVTAVDAQSNQHPSKQHAGHVSAQQLARRIRALEAKGYVQTSCTVGGTLMTNYTTGQSMTVAW